MQTELIEAHRELQECAQDRDKQRKAALDLRRLLGDESREKESIQASNQELRALIKRAESDNSRYRLPVNSVLVMVLQFQLFSFKLLTYFDQFEKSCGRAGAESGHLGGM